MQESLTYEDFESIEYDVRGLVSSFSAIPWTKQSFREFICSGKKEREKNEITSLWW